MKKTLIVTAHPSSKGFTHRIAEAYKKGKESKGDSVEILDLYKTDLKQDFLRYEERADMGNPDPVRDAMHEKITAADNLVLIHPLWWIGAPAILKNWVDVNISARYAFHYEKGRPVGHMKGKTASVFITCDGAFWLYGLIAFPFITIWRFGILGLCGFKVQNIKVLFQKFKATEAKQDAFLRKVESLARRKS
ncbi:MAG TPA: NAD(P)H-dependent oxidoreductase [Candidatus Paceibacterota bacterium]